MFGHYIVKNIGAVVHLYQIQLRNFRPFSTSIRHDRELQRSMSNLTSRGIETTHDIPIFIIFSSHRISGLIGRSICRRSLRDTELAAKRVVDGIETLQEGHAVDEVQADAGVITDVANDEVDKIAGSANSCIELRRSSPLISKKTIRTQVRERCSLLSARSEHWL